ncbi:MAG: hypothetical protein WCL30_06305 [Pseudomonadota bacterium]
MKQIKAYRKYWKNNPQLHLVVAALAGIKPEEEAKSEDDFFNTIAGMSSGVKIEKVAAK